MVVINVRSLSEQVCIASDFEITSEERIRSLLTFYMIIRFQVLKINSKLHGNGKVACYHDGLRNKAA